MSNGTYKKVGRPRTTIKSLPKNWKQIMINEANEGGGVTGMMVKLGIYHSALETLLEDSEIFRDVWGECLLLCQYWWETKGREMTCGNNGNAAVWSLNMTNRFNWRSSRQEHVGDKDKPLSLEVRKKDLTREEVMEELKKRGLPSSVFAEDKDTTK